MIVIFLTIGQVHLNLRKGDWDSYSKNYEKMAETLYDQESYNNPLIEL